VKTRLIFTLTLVILCSLVMYNRGSAAATVKQATPQGITLSPAVVQAEVASTESEHQLTFKITNNKPVTQNIDISSADFNTLDESGGLVFVGTNPTKLQKKYGLATWLRLPQTSVTLAPRQTAEVQAIISNEASLAPGGHYGAFMLSLTDESQPSGTNKVAVHPIASSLLFINKVGGDTHRLRLTAADTDGNIFKLPKTVTLRFYNDGNTHLIPRGTVTITDPRGKLVAKGIINENSNIILPETYRRFSVSLNRTSTALIPGKYKIITSFRFDGYDQFRSYQSSQYLLTPPLLVIALLIVVIIIAIVVFLSYKVRKPRSGFFAH
jgi:hypothetical protein